MKNAKKRVWSIVLTLAMLLSLLPVSAMAVWDTRAGEAGNPITATSNNITVNKYVSGNADDGYSLTLEAYAANRQTTTTTTTPLDIVLVLDVSGSMAFNFSGSQEENVPDADQRITALKTAVNSFIDSVAENAASSGADHKISIVKFAGNKTDDVGNGTYPVNIGSWWDPEYVQYNYSQIVEPLTSVSSGADTLKSQVNALTASGATQADYGMEFAQSVLNSSGRESKKVVIMFTDGQPTSGSRYEGAVAHGAINTAKELKDAGVTVYTIGIFGGADPNNTSDQTNTYMNAVSSKYPNAESIEIPGRWGSSYEVELGSPVDGSYYFVSSTAEGLKDVFRTIANTVTSNTLTANPDSEAVLSDTLSEYFNFPEGLTGQNPSGVTVEKVPVTGKAGNSYTWGSAQDISGEVRVTVSGDSINITGFDYKANAVTESTEGVKTTYSGYKLVVTFPIKVDMDACVSAPQESHSYPTNNVTHSKAGLFYKSEHAESNDTYTTLSASPTVTIAELDANGTDVTVQVHVDGELVANPLDYITLGRSTNDTAYSYFKTTVGPDGTVSCDFNYSPTGGNYDCVDLEVTVKNSSAYVLNGVNSYQSHGMYGTNNVTPSGSAYIIDNVTASPDDDVDCTIYLRSAYSVEYYQGGKLTEEPYNDQNTYVVKADVAASTEESGYPAEGNSAWMSWKNDEALTSISLPALPSVTGSDVDGWFLGSASGTKHESGSNPDVSAVKPDTGSVIKFYATSSTSRYTITINYQDAEGGVLQDAYTDTQDYNYEYSFDVSEEDEAVIPFIIVKDGTNYVFDRFADDTPLSGELTGDVEITAVYLIDENKNGTPDAYEATVTYKVENGTWADNTNVDKTKDFVLKTFDHDTNTWVAATPTPTLGDSFPTGMKPVTGYANIGSWSPSATADTEVTGDATYTYTFGTRMYTITINYQDKDGGALQDAYTDTQNDGYEYSFDVSEEDEAVIPFIIVKDGTNYVFDHFADSTPLSGTLTGDVEITAVYLIDANGNEVPDAYEATVTYKVVNGTWANDTYADKTEDFVLKTFDPESNTWVAATPAPTLGSTIPTNMKPVTGYANIGSWSPSATADTPVTGNEIYTYTFGTRMYTITINYVDDGSDPLKTAYTATQNNGYEYSFDVSTDTTGDIPFIIVKDGTNYVFDHFAEGSDPLSGTLTGDVKITAVYLIDENKNGTPDTYEATVTYKVVNGTWAEGGSEPKTKDFTLRTFNASTNSWVDVDPTPTLGDTIPTGMKPDANHTGSGEWDTAISADTKVTGDVTYTYTFSTEKAPALTVDKTVTSVGGTAVSDQSSIPSATAGDVIEYQIAVRNSGNVALSNVTVSDGKWASGVEIKVDGAASTLTGGSYTITSLDVGKSVTITYSYTVTDADVAAGKVTNNVTAKDGNDTKDDDTVEVPVSGTITITPANITIYMGGDEGYDAVVGENAQTTSSNSMPTPLFYVTVPSSLGDVNVSDIVLTGAENRKWEFELAGYDSAGKALYYINSTGFTDQESVRVTYTGSDGQAHISDSFNPSAVNDLFTTYEIAIYAGGAGKVEATVNGVRYGIATGTGTLHVRAVEDTEENPVVSVETTVTEPVASGEAAISAPANTSYTLNDTSVAVEPEGVGLLFDSIIDTDADRTGALLAALEGEYNIDIASGNYQAQYLDLVDANNGNAWVKASGKVTVYWGYPEGTDSSDNFTLYHFTDLHRDGSNSGFDIADIGSSDIKVVEVTKTAYGIAFEVETGGFSPFVLVWSDTYNPPIIIPPVEPEEPDYTPNWLNTTDHFGYIIGYEDGTVKPNAGITRAEVATIFFRLLTDEARERFWCETNDYSDVADGSWYNNAVSTLSNMGILGGYEDGTFRPNASITRAEFAKIAVSFFDWADIEAVNDFVDVSDSAWYADYVAVAAEIGLIEGYGGNVFRPEAAITRAEACAIINRTLGRAPDAEHLLPESQMNTWPDNSDTGVWYYAHIQEATNSHDYSWIGDIEQWTEKLPEIDWDKFQY